MSATLLEHFSKLKDPRIERNKKHELLDVIVLCICAMISGAEGWSGIEEFGKTKLDWLRQIVPLKNGIPVDDTIARIISALSVKGFQTCFSQWINDIVSVSDGEIIAIDGKTLRRSHDRRNSKKALHMVSAWACQNGVVLGQVKTHEKSNEITAIPELLEKLALTGCIVTIDAMGCQQAIATQIIDAKGDYVLALKDNQKNLAEAVRDYFERAKETNFNANSIEFEETIESGHGRIEVRRYWLSTELGSVPNPENWTGLKAIGLVESERHCGENISIEQRYFILSIDTVTVFKRAVRSHWGIENALHWRLDMTFREDESRIRRDNAAHNMGVIRHITLNLLKREKTKSSVKRKRLRAALSDDYRTKVLFAN